MFTRKTGMRIGLLLLGVALTVGFFEILEKRFAEGGLYPYYASFRSDPMGTSAFYEALEGIEDFEVSRNISDLNTLKGLDADTTILLVGYPREGFDSLRAPESSAVMKAVEEGARLVITMNPELVPEMFKPTLTAEEDDWIDRRRRIREERLSKAREAGEAAGEEAEKEAGSGVKGKVKDDAGKDEEEDEEEEEEKEMEKVLGPLFMTRVGFDFAPLEGFARPEEGWETSPGDTINGVAPGALPNWRSQYRFSLEDPSWKSVGLVEEKPVVIERPFGKGSIVLTSDSYFISNESLNAGTGPEFLLWLIGGKSRVIFDETIHGSQETGGAMKLLRRYRAHGVFFGLFVFLILWAWRSASSLVPGSEEQDRGIVSPGGMVVGEETGSGFIRLLRRSVPSVSLLSQCVDVWKRTLTVMPSEETEKRVDQILERHRSDSRRFGLIEGYTAITDLLRKR